jgi:hypothetical protein
MASSPLLNLSAELRTEIIDLVIQGSIQACEDEGDVLDHSCSPASGPPYSGLLRTNRQLHAETQKRMHVKRFSRNLNFTHPQCLWRWKSRYCRMFRQVNTVTFQLPWLYSPELLTSEAFAQDTAKQSLVMKSWRWNMSALLRSILSERGEAVTIDELRIVDMSDSPSRHQGKGTWVLVCGSAICHEDHARWR